MPRGEEELAMLMLSTAASHINDSDTTTTATTTPPSDENRCYISLDDYGKEALPIGDDEMTGSRNVGGADLLNIIDADTMVSHHP